LDSSINMGNSKPNMNINMTTITVQNDDTVISMLKHGNGNSNNITKGDDSMFLFNDSIILGNDQKNFVLEDKVVTKMVKKLSYVELMDEEEKKSDEFINFIIKLFSIFDLMEAGGIHLNDIGVGVGKHPFETFREFIRSFEIWGSYEPLKNIYGTSITDLSFYHANALNKIKEFVRKSDSFIQNNRQRPLSKLEENILEDLEIITSIFPILYQKLCLLQNKNKSNDTKTASSSANLEELNLISNRKTDVETTTKTIIDINAKVDGDMTNLITLSNLGNLIPLSCGHNGSLSKVERTLFEFHLINSGMMNSLP